MPVSPTSQGASATPPALLAASLDSLEISHYVDVSRSGLEFDDLVFRRDELRRSRTRDFQRIQLGTEDFGLERRGAYPYAIVLTNADFQVRLAEHLRPGCLVRFSSEGLWSHGVETLVSRLTTWFESVDLQDKRPEIVSRADWAFDFDLPKIDFDRTDFVTRLAKYAEHGENGRPQTYQLGKAGIVLRVYDKVTEIRQQSHKEFLFRLWGQNENVWRVEFQLRSNFLKGAGVRTFDELKNGQRALLSDLARDHTTLRERGEDSNRSRWPLHPLWIALLGAIDGMDGTGRAQLPVPARSLSWRRWEINKLLYAQLRSLAAVDWAMGRHDEMPTLEDALKALPSGLREHHEAADWEDQIERRFDALELGRW